MAHDLPVPTTVSPQLQEVIARHASPPTPAQIPASNAEWRAAYNPDPVSTRGRIDALLQGERLQMAQAKIGGVPCYVIEPADVASRACDRAVINLHGGGYVGGAGDAGLTEALMLAAVARIRVIAVDYRLAPDHPFPAAFEDTLLVWSQVASDVDASYLAVSGTSAGGALALALVQHLVAGSAPVPAAIIAGTPWSDLTKNGDSYFLNRYADPVSYEASLAIRAKQYAGGRDLKDPALSPIYGSFDGFPPTLLLTGTRDILLSATVRVDRKIRDAGGRPSLIVYEGVSHGRYLSGLAVPECRTAMEDMAEFLKRHLAPHTPSSMEVLK